LQTKLKDYNAQTYWVNLFPEKLGITGTKWPKWLGFSLGYGIDGFLGAEVNKWSENGFEYDYTNIHHSRQLYFSPALSLSSLHTNNKYLKLLFKITDYWKFPLPAVELSNVNKTKIHWIFW
jgi:hypothetical protein